VSALTCARYLEHIRPCADVTVPDEFKRSSTSAMGPPPGRSPLFRALGFET